MSLPHYAELFRAESLEHLSEINHLLLALEADPAQHAPLEGIFRAVHTIKGMAATMGYLEVAELTHEMENVLDRLRSGALVADPSLVETLFRVADAIEAGILEHDGDGEPVAPLLAQLRRLGSAAPDQGPAAGAPPVPDAPRAPRPATAPGRELRLRIVVAPDAPLPGVRAFLALRCAREMGEVREVTPAEEVLQGAEFEGVLAFRLRTEAAEAVVRERLAAVGDVASVEVLADPEERAAVPAPAAAFARIGSRNADRHVRVEAVRLDSLMDRVGEMVIVRDRLRRVAATLADEELSESVDQVTRLIGEMRDEILGVRMVSIGDVFDRFPRLVRDAARVLGKRVDLIAEGHEIEVDRSLVEQLGDPLVHLLRNAIDHGIEPPEERRARGKPEAGRLWLSARRERNRVLIRIQDDGRGIDRARVLARAVEMGLVADAAAPLADEEVFAFLTRSGFSTAERVTDVSGRGVGLDVVATHVRALGGTLEITSRPGEGTAFLLRLPLTVGILRALLVSAGGCSYAIPVAHVAETVEFAAHEIRTSAGRRVALLRGDPVPLVRLGDVLGMADRAAPPERVAVVLLETDEEWIGLEVDTFLGQQEIVTKPFDGARGILPVFAGATILADGRPALILDASALILSGRHTAPPARAGSLTSLPDGR